MKYECSPCTGEALCPYCARFIDDEAARIHDNGVMDITSFRYIAYGNAKNTKASPAHAGGLQMPSELI